MLIQSDIHTEYANNNATALRDAIIEYDNEYDNVTLIPTVYVSDYILRSSLVVSLPALLHNGVVEGSL